MSEATRRRLLAAGRRAFAARGFADASAEEICDKAPASRAARCTISSATSAASSRRSCDVLLAEVAEHVAKETMPAAPSRRTSSSAAATACSRATAVPSVRSILLRDAPVVLGLATWQRLQEEAGQSAFLRHASRALGRGGVDRAPTRVEPLARLLLGALMQAALAIGEAGDRGAEHGRYRNEIRALLSAIRA